MHLRTEDQKGGTRHMKRGCCIRSPLATKLLHVVLFHEDNTQRELTKNPAIGIHVTEAYTEFQQCPFITFEDMNILLSATSNKIPCNNNIIIPNIGFMVLKTTDLNRVFQRKNQFWKIFTKSWDMSKNVSGSFRDFCYKQQNKTMKNKNVAQKNAHIFISNALILLKLGVGLDYMYTQGWFFLAPSVYCPH